MIVFGGNLFGKSDIEKGKARKGTIIDVEDNLFLAAKKDDRPSPDDFLNHSCDPNLWLKDAVTLIARRNIKKDEEITADYGTRVSRKNWVMKCSCGAKKCRKIITSNDWKLKKLQTIYKNHFSPYLNRKIKRINMEV